MIGLSEIAATALVESLEAIGVGTEKGLRLSLKGDQPVLELDSCGDNDNVIQHNGAIVLIVDKDIEAKIGDAFIDVEGDPNEPHLTIRRHVLHNDE